MIIKSLTLNNFRVFNGVNDVELTPVSSDKPIVLFGGLNGSGKTSVLTGVRLALYGRAAFGYVMTSSQYQEQLDALIHMGTGVQQSRASLELVFTYSQHGEEHEYKVIRSWERGKKEKLSLSKNEVLESSLSHDQCQAFLNELIPIGIADLFFFDGEKIAELAEDESGSVLQTAVRRLLGIDVIERLKNDLNVFLKPYQSQAIPQKIKKEIDALELQRKEHERKYDCLINDADELEKPILAIIDLLKKEETELMSLGGAWAATKAQEEAKVKELQLSKNDLESRLRREMEGGLPFALAPNTLQSLVARLEEETEVKRQRAFLTEFSKFQTQVLENLSGDYDAKSSAREALEKCLSDYSEQTGSNSQEDIQLDLSDRETAKILHQVQVLAVQSKKEFENLKAELKKVEDALDNAAVAISRAPDDSRLSNKLEDISKLNDRKSKAIMARANKLNIAKKEVEAAIEISRKVQQLHDKYKSEATVTEAVVNAQNTNLLLNDFAKKLTTVKVRQLEDEFIKSYQKLARKEDIKISARINTQSFDVELIDESGNAINRKELSAGEKQIYAIAILEALGKTSGRKLPIIIDTPLGRLDSKHRDKLIELYFPNASHQVIILSTDTEVDEKYFNHGAFSEYISHSYEIQFDAETKSSKVNEGYFWRNQRTDDAVKFMEVL
ncbi:DNA sulfur modification protein DndD [Alteromonas ponticola]|uniref:DNA sulfur modification protein DndD n=1 Tax=Alteromonas aquimaris TaxID=2998417 RepID=A0ABT3P2Y4_9ALTE|nr:DNA sulfur modification protein DndD [Alteromonas aquimaris]MCW8107119.1 DNA sulfur modification protein DndD [Alteromonas aquimaris]